MNIVTAEAREIWKDIPEYEGYYQASNCGRIKSVDRIIIYKSGASRFFRGKILKPSRDSDGYKIVSLWKSGGLTLKVHSLVALSFMGERPVNLQVRHLNGKKIDNRLINLKYGTDLENKEDSRIHGTLPKIYRGHTNIMAKLSKEEAVIIRKYEGLLSCGSLAKKYNVHEETIRRIWRRITYV